MNKLFLIGWLALMTLLACEGDRRHGVRLLEAERLVETRPDSALLLLERMGDPAGWPSCSSEWAIPPAGRKASVPGGLC